MKGSSKKNQVRSRWLRFAGAIGFAPLLAAGFLASSAANAQPTAAAETAANDKLVITGRPKSPPTTGYPPAIISQDTPAFGHSLESDALELGTQYCAAHGARAQVKDLKYTDSAPVDPGSDPAAARQLTARFSCVAQNSPQLQGLTGVWSGTAYQWGATPVNHPILGGLSSHAYERAQRAGDSISSYHVNMKLNGQTGTISYPDLGCDGSLTSIGRQDDTYFYWEQIDHGAFPQGQCDAARLISVKPKDAGVQWNLPAAAALGLTVRAQLSAQSACTPPSEPPAVDAKAATVDRLLAAKHRVIAFIAASDIYQTCVLEDLKSQRAAAQANKTSLSPTAEALAQANIDRNQAAKERVGTSFNNAFKTYQAAHPS